MQRASRCGLARRDELVPEHLRVDETSFQQHHEYVPVMTDQKDGRVLYVADEHIREGESNATVLGVHNGRAGSPQLDPATSCKQTQPSVLAAQ